MYKFQIEVIKDLSSAEKILNKPLFLLYKGVVNRAYSMFVVFLGDKVIKKRGFNVMHEKDKTIWYRETETREELETDLKNLQDFLISDEKELKENENFLKIVSNRAVNTMYNKFIHYASGTVIKGTVLYTLNTCGLFISYKILD